MSSEYKIKGSNRDRRKDAEKKRMPKDNRSSIRLIQDMIVKRGREAQEKLNDH